MVLRDPGQIGTSHLFAAFRGPHFWTTFKVSLMVAGAQGGGYALSIWMPTYLRTVRGLSAICSATAFGLKIVMLLLLPETHGRSLATLETAAAGA